MKIWELKVDTGKRDNSMQYQFVNRNRSFLEDFEKKIDMAEKQNGCLDNIEAHVIHGRVEYDMSILWNGPCLFLLNEKAKRVLEPLLNESVEFIPIKSKNELYLMNILCVQDVLDYDNIVADRYDGMIYFIKKFAFIQGKVSNVPIFKIMCNGIIYVTVFVTEEFKKIVEENQLTGFEFLEVGDY